MKFDRHTENGIVFFGSMNEGAKERRDGGLGIGEERDEGAMQKSGEKSEIPILKLQPGCGRS